MVELEPVSLLPPLPTPKRKAGAKRRRLAFVGRNLGTARLHVDGLLIVAYLDGVREFLPDARRGGVFSTLDDSNIGVNADTLAEHATGHYADCEFPLDWSRAAPYARRVLEAYDPERKSRSERHVFATCVAAALYLTFAQPMTATRLLELNSGLDPWRAFWARGGEAAFSDA
jgi:hypothetical protein